ncbi:LIC_10190 family membrane protein [Nonlabens marinus]|uniref:Cytoplasmic membrane protein n=1 Tax=Nonlabens marinus S1-08 TaxID=1454201 RepID=W8VU29_9FLAO|nr:hypothetical protein [Nonlabens marinus]BAO54208.1 cytoplasmic membrane protein [Nonlabens marinus S1-08]
MAVLFLYFMFLTLVSVGVGAFASRIFTRKSLFLLDIVWMGMASIALCAGVWSFFGSLNYVFSTIISIVALISMAFVPYTRQLIWSIIVFFLNLPKLQKMGIILITLLILAFGTLSGYVLDNDSYYIQTIKWLDTYALVPGIANWHLFLAQQSGFHVLEAALNFDFFNISFNDTGLFLTLVMVFWSILPAVIEESTVQKAYRNLMVLVLSVLLLLGTAPSPDVPVILIHYYVIYKFLFPVAEKQSENLLISIALVSLACYFKMTAIYLTVFPVFLFIKGFKSNWKSAGKLAVFPFAFLVVIIIKNGIASGYPLFPLTFVSLNVDWILPLEMAQFYTAATEAQAYGIAVADLQSLGAWERMVIWLTQDGVEGWINIFIGLVIVSSSIATLVFFKKSRLRTVFIVFLLFSITLFLTSPQARFFLPLLFPALILLGIYSIPVLRKRSYKIAVVGIIASSSMLIVPSVVALLTDNPRMKQVPTFSIDHMIYPGAASRFGTAFAKANINNITYNNPESADFFYGSYDIPLPAAQPEYFEYFRTYFMVSPEYRGDSPQQGFRAIRN